MSLRDALRAAVEPAVACCAPLAMQHATPALTHATAGATAVQRQGGMPGKAAHSNATRHATAMQHGSCMAPDSTEGDATELHVALARRRNTQLAARLAAAINAATLARGDTETNRRELMAEALALPLAEQLDLAEHFEEVAAVWRKAVGQP